MTPPTEEQSPLLPQWAFVVQFRAETDVERGACTGRVEHVVSGQAAHFQSLEELLAFIARVLATVRGQPRSEPELDEDEPTVRRRKGP
jgi:hypothetical protein